MNSTNSEIASLFDELADIMELAGENYFKIKAYRTAAEAIRRQPRGISGMTVDDISKIPGVGEAISAKIGAALDTGTFPALEKWRQDPHASLRPLLAVPGLTMRQIRALMKALKISSMDDLRRAVADGRLQTYDKLDNEKKMRIERLTENGL